MKLFLLFLLALLASAGLLYWRGWWAPKPVSAAIHAAAVRQKVGALLGEGTVVISHSFLLPVYQHGSIKRLYVEDGQYIGKHAHEARFQPPTPALLVHSARGGQYGGNAYRKLLHDHEALRSQSRRGDCYDKAQAENRLAVFVPVVAPQNRSA